jgi:hypothetical protein
VALDEHWANKASGASRNRCARAQSLVVTEATLILLLMIGTALAFD